MLLRAYLQLSHDFPQISEQEIKEQYLYYIITSWLSKH
jgi:hypothetical protein